MHPLRGTTPAAKVYDASRLMAAIETFKTVEVHTDTYKNTIDATMESSDLNDKQIDLFILDVEGHELSVLEGMNN